MKKIFILLLSAFVIQSCDFDQFQEDPNRTTEANPGLILTNLTVNSFNNLDISAQFASRMMVWVDGQDLSQYYNWNRAGFDNYDQLRQTVKMIEESERTGLPNYAAIAKFFQAFHYYQLTMVFGDIPFSQALGGFEDNFQPTYDPQEDVFAGVLMLLDEANAELASNGTQVDLVGDVLFDGDIQRWRRAINSFRLRVLMTLSAKEGNSSINIRQQFNDVFSDPVSYPLMGGNQDNLALQHFNIAGSRYPFFNNQNFKVAYPLETTLVEMMKEREDPRLFAIADINANSSDPANFDSYGGLSGGADFETLQSQFLTGIGSFPDARYSDDPATEPSVTMSYAELQLILAEAVELGWISGDAQVFYNAGVRANLEFYGIDPGSVATYLAHPLVAYGGGDGIEQINTQKYLTYFLSSGWEPFYNQRRTGIPTFSTTDFNEGLIPVRWMYPQSELNLNANNVQEAVQRQFGGNDNINGQMWLVN